MTSALKLVTNLKQGNMKGVEVNDLTQSSKGEHAEAAATFIAVENASELVTMGELARFNEVHKVVLPNFNKHTRAHGSH